MKVPSFSAVRARVALLVALVLLALSGQVQKQAHGTNDLVQEKQSAGIAYVEAEFIKAILAGNTERILHHLKSGANPNLRTSDRGFLDLTPLHWALMANRPEIAKILLEHGADPTIFARNPPVTALHLAVTTDEEVALLMIEKGIALDVKDGVGRTPLFYAARDDRIDLLRALINKGADINAIDDTGATILISALRNGQREAAKFLLQMGAPTNESGYSPIVLAAENGYLDIVNMLITRGVDFRKPSMAGDTALKAAARNGHRDIARFLIERGMDVNQGQPILGAAFHNRLDMVKLLLENGAEVNAQDSQGRTALWMVSGDDYEDMMRLLLMHGARVNVQSIYGETPLMLASRSGQTRVVQLLLDYGADVHIRDKDGYTALDYAKGHPQIQKKLIDSGAKR